MTSTQKRILSFDIGIKNLSLCYLSQEGADTYQILDWAVINLMEGADAPTVEATPPPKCACEIKAIGKKKPAHPCGKDAKFLWENQPYCERHAKTKEGVIIPKKAHELSWLIKQKNPILEDLYTKTTGQPGTDPRPRTKKDLAEYLAKYYQERSFQLVVLGSPSGRPTNAGDLDLITIGRNMVSHLDAFCARHPAPTHVIIENQISTIASRMKTIQGEVTMYFLMKSGGGCQIEYISPRNKLKMGGGAEGATKKKTDYKTRKNDAIEFTKKILEETPTVGSKWLPIFLGSRKKIDDLADCFLQGLWYMKHKN